MKQSDAVWFSGPQHSILGSQTLAAGAGSGAGVGGYDKARVDINCKEPLIQDLVFHRLENKLLTHVLHTRSAVSRRPVWESSIHRNRLQYCL